MVFWVMSTYSVFGGDISEEISAFIFRAELVFYFLKISLVSGMIISVSSL